MSSDMNIPDEDRWFVEKQRKEWQGKYDILISLVGRSPQPIRRTILSIMPKKTYLLATEGSKEEAFAIIKELNIGVEAYSIKELKSDSKEIYDTIKDIILRNKGKRIALDISGGKKSMVGMATVAGAFYGLGIVYNNYSKYDSVSRRPIPGSEYLEKLLNPFNTSGDLLLSKAVELFNHYNFNAVISLLEKEKKVARDPRTGEVLVLLATALKEWSSFDFKKAHDTLKKGYEKAEQYGIYPFCLKKERLLKNIEFLEPLRDVKSTAKTEEYFKNISSAETAQRMIVSVFNSARRYEKLGRFDEAILRYYRTIEMVSQHLLGLRGINTADTDKAEIITGQVRSEFADLRKRITKDPNRPVMRRQIGLIDGFILLKVIGEPAVEEIDIQKEILPIIEPRNHSYLIHGWSLGGQKESKNLRSLADRLMKKAGIRDELIKAGEFPKLES